MKKVYFSVLALRQHQKHALKDFADHYTNSWPLYFSDGIRRGQSYAIQYLWRPDKKNELYIRWQRNQVTSNQAVEESRTHLLKNNTSDRIRLHISSMIGSALTLRYRSEILWIRRDDGSNEKGVLTYAEIIMKSVQTRFSMSARFTLFETDSYASRVYAYERDVLSYHAIPAHYDHGTRSYLLLQYKLNRAVQLAAKCIQQNRESSADYRLDFDRIRQIEWRFQLTWKIGS